MSGRERHDSGKSPSVVIVTPSPYTRYGLGVAQQLSENGVHVKGIVVRKMFNWNRIVSEFRRDGRRLLAKIWNNLLRRNRSQARVLNASTGFQRFYQQTGCKHDSLKEWAREYEADYRAVDDLSSGVTIGWLQEKSPDCVIFCGGGLIRKPFLEAAGKGVLNAHAGVLPEYRGMDLPEWAILRKDFANIGFTVHLMDEGVDTGPILSVQRVELTEGDDRGSLRDRIASRMADTMVNTIIAFLSGKLHPREQRPQDGRQYFVMCDRLLSEVDARLKSYKRKDLS